MFKEGKGTVYGSEGSGKQREKDTEQREGRQKGGSALRRQEHDGEKRKVKEKIRGKQKEFVLFLVGWKKQK